jgi:deoxyadenosine/deoxycytidine kinase
MLERASLLEGKYIAIEGNIGSGKTTLAKILAEQLKAKLVLEEFEENPFLGRFYEDKQRYAFSVEMSFLADRYHQLSALPTTQDLFLPNLVADYAPFKSLIFAQSNLPEVEFQLYHKFWKMALGKVRQPDLLIFLQRPISSLLKNIDKRGRSFEKNISENYLLKLNESYASFMKQNWQNETLYLEADPFDFLQSESDVNTVDQKILEKYL